PPAHPSILPVFFRVFLAEAGREEETRAARPGRPSASGLANQPWVAYRVKDGHKGPIVWEVKERLPDLRSCGACLPGVGCGRDLQGSGYRRPLLPARCHDVTSET